MAAGVTYEPIQTTTLTSAQSSITFSSIPSTYTDLRVVFTLVGTSANPNCYLRFNSDTATNYSSTWLSGYGTGYESLRGTNKSEIGMTWWGSIGTGKFGFYTADIFSYAGNTFKTVLISSNEDFNGSGDVSRFVGLWRSTSAISTILIKCDQTNGFGSGTIATLYGIKAA